MATPPTPEPISRRDWIKDLGLIVLLLALIATLRGAIVARTVVPARDAIGYIRYALEFEKFSSDGAYGWWDAWQTVLNRHHQHPGYPLTVLAVSLPVRAWHGGTDADVMQLSAQLASNLAAVLLVLPMFLLGKNLFDRRIAFWGTLLFHVLPVSGHVLSDALSESLFLLLSVTALLFAVQGMRALSPRRFVWCGLFCGASYLTRPEGALVLLAAGLMLAGAQVIGAWRRPWKRFALTQLCLLAPGIAVGALYWAATHKFTNKPSIEVIIHGSAADGFPAERLYTESAPPLFASAWGAAIRDGGSTQDRLARGALALASELAHSFHYVGWVPVLLGFVWSWRRLRSQAGFWVLATLCTLHGALLCALVVKVGYVSDRHVLILVLCGCYFLAVGLREAPAYLHAWWQRRRSADALAHEGNVAEPRAAYGIGLMLLMIAACLPKTLQPLHHNRAGHYAAGLWLAGQLRPGDEVHDDHCWSHYYAGQVFREGRAAAVEPGHAPTRYFVITRSRDPEIAPSRIQNETRVREADGVLVYHWPCAKPLEAARVVVYAVPHAKCVAHGLLPKP